MIYRWSFMLNKDNGIALVLYRSGSFALLPHVYPAREYGYIANAWLWWTLYIDWEVT